MRFQFASLYQYFPLIQNTGIRSSSLRVSITIADHTILSFPITSIILHLKYVEINYKFSHWYHKQLEEIGSANSQEEKSLPFWSTWRGSSDLHKVWVEIQTSCFFSPISEWSSFFFQSTSNENKVSAEELANENARTPSRKRSASHSSNTPLSFVSSSSEADQIISSTFAATTGSTNSLTSLSSSASASATRKSRKLSRSYSKGQLGSLQQALYYLEGKSFDRRHIIQIP